MSVYNKSSKEGVNVQVILRCRPFSKAECVKSELNRNFVVCKEEAKEVLVSQNVGGGKQLERSFHFDKVFGPNSGQEKLYVQAISPIVDEVLEGFNCTIFAYGQTGTGKTFTMEGGYRDSKDGNNLSEVAGVIPRAIHHIFTALDSNDKLYNEETTDLLAVGDRQDQKLRIMEDKNGVVIQGLEEFIVKSSTDIYALLDRGSAKRRVAETMLNKQSSRSHGVFCITVHIREIVPDGEEVIKIGKLYLVDLAGSENVSRSGAAGTMAKEAGSINKSLLTLGRVITALVEGSGHIPYRDSKLTRLLRDSLGGKTKTCIIATIAPTTHCQDETLSTLDYAHRAKNIRNKPEVNQKISKSAHIKELNAEIARLKLELIATREKNGIYVPEDQYVEKEESAKVTSARLENLEVEFESYRKLQDDEQTKLKSEINVLHQELHSAISAYKKLRLGIKERDFLILTYQRSEDAIVKTAGDVTNKLIKSDLLMRELHKSLNTYHTREDKNLTVVTDLCSFSKLSLQSMQALFSQCILDVNGLLKNIELDISTLATERDFREKKITQNIMDMKRQLHEFTNNIRDQVTQNDKEIGNAMKFIESYEDQFVKNFIQEIQLRKSKSSDHIQNVMSLQKMMVLSFNELIKKRKELVDMKNMHMLNLSSQFSMHLHQSVDDKKELVNLLACNADAQNKHYDEVNESFIRNVQAEKATIIKQISELLEKFAAQCSTQVLNFTSSAKVSNSDLKNNLTRKLGEFEAGANLTDEGIRVRVVRVLIKLLLNPSRKLIMKAEIATANKIYNDVEAVQLEEEGKISAALGNAESNCHDLEDMMSEAFESLSTRIGKHIVDQELNIQEKCLQLKASIEDYSTDFNIGMDNHLSNLSQLDNDQRNLNQDLVTITSMANVINVTEQKLTDHAQSHHFDIAKLLDNIEEFTNTKYKKNPAPESYPSYKATELPQLDWCEKMKPPAPEIVLADFRRRLQENELTSSKDDCPMEKSSECNIDGCEGTTVIINDENALKDISNVPKDNLPSYGHKEASIICNAEPDQKRQRVGTPCHNNMN